MPGGFDDRSGLPARDRARLARPSRALAIANRSGFAAADVPFGSLASAAVPSFCHLVRGAIRR